MHTTLKLDAGVTDCSPCCTYPESYSDEQSRLGSCILRYAEDVRRTKDKVNYVGIDGLVFGHDRNDSRIIFDTHTRGHACVRGEGE